MHKILMERANRFLRNTIQRRICERIIDTKHDEASQMKHLLNPFALLLALVSTLSLSNLFLVPRDGVATIQVESFDIEKIYVEKLLAEAPMQIFHTYLARSRFYGFGSEEGFYFNDRLSRIYGKDNVDESAYFDLRGDLSPEQIQSFEVALRSFSYRYEGPCPHDLSTSCTFATTWNRDRKDKKTVVVAARMEETLYFLAEQSVFPGGLLSSNR